MQESSANKEIVKFQREVAVVYLFITPLKHFYIFHQ